MVLALELRVEETDCGICFGNKGKSLRSGMRRGVPEWRNGGLERSGEAIV